jgi:hypothetical protein
LLEYSFVSSFLTTFEYKRDDFSPAIFATVCGFLGEWFYNPLSGFSGLKKFILSTGVNKSKIKEQMRFCYICPNVKAINLKAAKDNTFAKNLCVLYETLRLRG